MKPSKNEYKKAEQLQTIREVGREKKAKREKVHQNNTKGGFESV